MRLIIYSCLLFVLSLSAHAEDVPRKTIITDQAEADLLEGRHLMTQTILSFLANTAFEQFGEANIVKNNGHYSLNANYVCYQEKLQNPGKIRGGHIRLDGNILKIQKNQFTVKGRFSYLYYSEFYKPREEKCNIDGEFTFIRSKNRKYWSMFRPEGTCLEWHPPMFIFTEALNGEPPQETCAPDVESARKASHH